MTYRLHGKSFVGSDQRPPAIPWEDIPIHARNVKIEWVLGGIYYLISFTVGKDEPSVNMDLEIPGKRGGTLKTRYFGQLEGVSSTTKIDVEHAAAKENMSIHEWLEKKLSYILKNNI